MGKMENVSHLDTDTLASNYVILSDDLSYAKTFYPGSDGEVFESVDFCLPDQYLRAGEIGERILPLWVRSFRCCSIERGGRCCFLFFCLRH